jgi:Reverse transcriptase (RNA-dependent DNA polymerase)/Endonuclease-reverse transcriptase
LFVNVEKIETYVKLFNHIKKNFLKQYDLLLFVETYLLDADYTIEGFKSIHILGRETGGRPMRGTSLFYNARVGKLKHYEFEDDIIIAYFNHISVICAYLPPDMLENEVQTQLLDILDKVPCKDNLILAGDLNCRIDNPISLKGQCLIDLADETNLTIANNDFNARTYIVGNKSSTVDVALFGKNISKLEFELLPVMSFRGHVPFSFKFSAKIPDSQSSYSSKYIQRKLDENLVNENITFLINNLNFANNTGNIELFNKELNSFINFCRLERNESARASKSWFNSACYAQKKKVLQAYRPLKYTNDHYHLANYSNEKRIYKEMCYESSLNFAKKEEINLLNKIEIIPYQIFTLNKAKRVENAFDIDNLVSHATKLVNKDNLPHDGRLGFRDFLVNNDYGRDLRHDPISRTELEYLYPLMKNNKAAGTDNIFNENLKTVFPHILPQIQNFLNNCLEQSLTPKQWKESKLKMLYKGKGDREDVNSYRGISIGNSLFNLLDKIMYYRILKAFEEHIPANQFGFLPYRSTLQAIERVHGKILETLNSETSETCLFVVFIDLNKAFDTLDRKFLFQKLMSANKLSYLDLKFIAETLDVNFLKISDGVYESETIVQSNGVRQGAPSAPLNFDIAISDAHTEVFSKYPGIDTTWYADDGCFSSTDLNLLKCALTDLVPYLKERGLSLNVKKTKVVKFRRGGKRPLNEELTLNGENIEFVPTFNYLGVTFQTTGSCFTQHIIARARAARFAGFEIKNLSKLSMETALKIFHMKVAPMATYAIQIVWQFLSLQNLLKLESVKACFLKRALCLSQKSRSRFSYALADTTFFVEEIREQFKLPKTQNYKDFIELQYSKLASIDEDFHKTQAMQTTKWKEPQFDKKHIFTRFAVHGFHYHICENTKYHESALETCICTLCNEKCSQYHLEKCSKRILSVTHYATLPNPSKS